LRVLILTSDAGHGHRSAAEAIAAAIQERYPGDCEVVTSNPAREPEAPDLLRGGELGYDRIVQELPELYESAYEISDSQFASTIGDAVLAVFLFGTIRHLIRQHRPDVIVSTYPLYQGPIGALKLGPDDTAPLVTVVTDLVSIHNVWFSKAADYCIVPTDTARELALQSGLSPGQIKVCGIPVHPDIVHSRQTAAEAKATLGWRQDLTTLLVIGGELVNGMVDALRVLDHSGLPIQLVAVAGRDKALLEQLEKTCWHATTRVYGYVSDMPSMMAASDAVICKAGGLTVAEALASGLPIILLDALPGQEEGNAQYVVEKGAGEQARDAVAILAKVYHWLDQEGTLLKKRAHRAQELGRPQAAFDVANFVFSVAARKVEGQERQDSPPHMATMRADSPQPDRHSTREGAA